MDAALSVCMTNLELALWKLLLSVLTNAEYKEERLEVNYTCGMSFCFCDFNSSEVRFCLMTM